ncbi:MAG: restriction endonuclease [Parcubacteria group bacterium]|nr:restriction endonuclease [Parcubacteria group bacterium]
MLEINQIHQGDSAELLKQFDDNFVDLTVTSPPYDNLRDYKGYNFNFKTIAKELYRITKDGGILVWIIGDQTKDFSESLSSFKQVIFFVDCGFNLLDTMIYQKKNVPPTYPNMRRYVPSFEYMFVLSKGKPMTFNPIIDRPNKYAGIKKTGDTQRQKDGSTKKVRGYIPKEFGMRFNIWNYDVGRNKDTKDIIAFKHPARFPEDLAKDHILSWSNKGDLVLDPLCGSGTTLKMAKLLNRRYIGIDSAKEYVEIAQKRLSQKSLLPLAEKKDGGNGIPPTLKSVGILPKIL